LNKLKKEYNDGRVLSMQDFCNFLTSSTAEWKKFERKTIILEEVLRILFNLELPLKEGLNHPLSMKSIEGAEKLFQKSKKYLEGKSRQKMYLLDLVWMGENPAIVSFQNQEYTCQVLDKATQLYRAGNSGPNRELGQYWTRGRAPDISFIRQSCAVKDNWDVNSVTLDEVFVPYVDSVYTFEVTENLVAFEGKAAPLHDFMKVDELAKKIFCGGGGQLLVVNPRNIKSRLIQKGDKGPLKGCSPWELLGYTPSKLAEHAFGGHFEKPENRRAKLSLADDTLKDEHGLTPLHYACLSVDGRVETIKHLLGCNADPCIESGPSSGCVTPLIIAAMVGNATNIETLLEFSKRTGEEMFKAEKDNTRNPLHFAAKFGHDKALETMFSKVTDYLRPPAPDPVDKAGCTPLWVACRHGKKLAAEVLIKYKANINHELLLQNETLALAVDDFQKKAADWDDSKHLFLVGTTPLHTAVLGGHSGIVKLLIDKKCAAPREGLDLLHRAVCTGNKEVVEILAKRGEDIGMKVNAGRSKSGLATNADAYTKASSLAVRQRAQWKSNR
jgi:ankyrin repeat protein